MAWIVLRQGRGRGGDIVGGAQEAVVGNVQVVGANGAKSAAVGMNLHQRGGAVAAGIDCIEKGINCY